MLSRSSRILLALLFLFSAYITWIQLFDAGVAFDSRWPLLDIVAALGDLLWLLLMLVPIIVADAVVRDYKQRLHELIMTTAVPTWAYVWGRFLAGLCICFLLA
jgi:ABC-type transport system involved in multi-copper enzyme maturation permease subunit